MMNVKVAVRIRPFLQRELTEKDELIVHKEDNAVLVASSKVLGSQVGDVPRKIRRFTVDLCYDSKDTNNSNQEAVYREIGLQVLNSMFDGVNASVLAYGHSASGKTYTMMGTPDDPGLSPRICRGLFDKMSPGTNDQFQVTVRFVGFHGNLTVGRHHSRVSFLEIYNEKVRDLLARDDTGPVSSGGSPLRVREHPKSGPYVQELSEVVVTDKNHLLELLNFGNARRSTASTQSNVCSSRSHAVFTLLLKQSHDERQRYSKVHLVDLAGSERAKGDRSKMRMKEGANINKSLATLGNVISALAECYKSERRPSALQIWQPFVPYRDSVLTWLLKEALGGNSRTTLIATVSPASSCLYETINTLRYAQRTKRIINRPNVNEDTKTSTIQQLRREIFTLKSMLSLCCKKLKLRPLTEAEGNRRPDFNEIDGFPDRTWTVSTVTSLEGCEDGEKEAACERRSKEEEKGGDREEVYAEVPVLEGATGTKLSGIEGEINGNSENCSYESLKMRYRNGPGAAEVEGKKSKNGASADSVGRGVALRQSSLAAGEDGEMILGGASKNSHEMPSAAKGSLIKSMSLNDIMPRSGGRNREYEAPAFSGKSNSCSLKKLDVAEAKKEGNGIDDNPVANSAKIGEHPGRQRSNTISSEKYRKKKSEITDGASGGLHLRKGIESNYETARGFSRSSDEIIEDLKSFNRPRMKLCYLNKKLEANKKSGKPVDSETQTDFHAKTIRMKEKSVITETFCPADVTRCRACSTSIENPKDKNEECKRDVDRMNRSSTNRDNVAETEKEKNSRANEHGGNCLVPSEFLTPVASRNEESFSEDSLDEEIDLKAFPKAASGAEANDVFRFRFIEDHDPEGHASNSPVEPSSPRPGNHGENCEIPKPHHAARKGQKEIQVTFFEESSAPENSRKNDPAINGSKEGNSSPSTEDTAFCTSKAGHQEKAAGSPESYATFKVIPVEKFSSCLDHVRTGTCSFETEKINQNASAANPSTAENNEKSHTRSTFEKTIRSDSTYKEGADIQTESGGKTGHHFPRKISWTDADKIEQKQFFNLNILGSPEPCHIVFDGHSFEEIPKRDSQKRQENSFASDESIALAFLGPGQYRGSVLMEIVRPRRGKGPEGEVTFHDGKFVVEGIKRETNLIRSASVDTALIALSEIAEDPLRDISKGLDDFTEESSTILNRRKSFSSVDNVCRADLSHSKKKSVKYPMYAKTNRRQTYRNARKTETNFNNRKHIFKVPPASVEKNGNGELSNFSGTCGLSHGYRKENGKIPKESSSRRSRVKSGKPKGAPRGIRTKQEEAQSTQTLTAFFKEATALLKNINHISFRAEESENKLIERSNERNAYREDRNQRSRPTKFPNNAEAFIQTGRKAILDFGTPMKHEIPSNSGWLGTRSVTPNPQGKKNLNKSQASRLLISTFSGGFRSSNQTRRRLPGKSAVYAVSKGSGEMVKRFPTSSALVLPSYFHQKRNVSLKPNAGQFGFNSVAESEIKLKESCRRLRLIVQQDKIRREILERKISKVNGGTGRKGNLRNENRFSNCESTGRDALEEWKPSAEKTPVKRREPAACTQKCECENRASHACSCTWLRVIGSTLELDTRGPGSNHCHQFCMFCHRKEQELYSSTPSLNSDCSSESCRLNYYGHCPCSPVKLPNVASSPRAYMQHLLTLRRRIIGATKIYHF